MTALVDSSNTASLPTPPKDHSHICPYCPSTFRRDEHLQRHIRSHTGEKKYRCPCNRKFARNDVFVRHMRGCQSGLSDDFWRIATNSKSQTKRKRACDECAKAKAKCDYQSPCERCHRKSLTCEKNRKGYEDPYALYSVTACADIDDVDVQSSARLDETDTSSSSNGHAEMESPAMNDTTMQALDTTGFEQNDTYGHQQHDQQSIAMALSYPQFSPRNEPPMAGSLDGPIIMPEFDSFMDQDGIPFQPDPALIHFASLEGLEHLFDPQGQNVVNQDSDFFLFPQPSTPFTGSGFSLARLDPVEAKCNELIKLLSRTDSEDSENMAHAFITRHNMIHLCHLYGKHFQRNLPIIHSSTFDMLKSPPALLLAIMLVGACYSKDTIPANQVSKLTLRLHTAIGLDPDEISMGRPTISMIQAGILVCCILTCCQDAAAHNAVRVCFARNISMCERAGAFEQTETVDYSALTEETFNWNMWIERETLNRVAGEIFCQDMVHCIFLGRTPAFDPRRFPVHLPDYETCWEAENASDCLHLVQSLARPMRVSGAIGMLMSWPDIDSPLFEVSGFAMNLLIHALHFFLHQAIQADEERTSNHSPVSLSQLTVEIPDPETIKSFEQLKDNLSGPTITAIADKAVRIWGSREVRAVDNALNAWHATWDMRRTRDSQSEGFTFKGDGLPFFWLAKLYLALHYYSHVLQPDSEFATSRVDGWVSHGKTAVQRKIVGWLSSFRGQRSQVDTKTEIWLSDLMAPRREVPS